MKRPALYVVRGRACEYFSQPLGQLHLRECDLAVLGTQVCVLVESSHVGRETPWGQHVDQVVQRHHVGDTGVGVEQPVGLALELQRHHDEPLTFDRHVDVDVW